MQEDHLGWPTEMHRRSTRLRVEYRLKEVNSTHLDVRKCLKKKKKRKKRKS